ncbi:MAG: ribbon-helix-helix protein, CopG family [Deltaproteobacteria bacterium]|nr:ribbon-helix-helix protein, CopG family [Deltaproteobacteria bacterium]MBI3390709.1 ribbon-helix-helix protein, CopG family [Deltaproteobacteria bacterium]
MKRTQLYLDEDSARRLAAESRRRRTTISELVREAVAATYGGRAVEDRSAVIRQMAGIWAERDDMTDSYAYVRNLRRSERPQRSVARRRGQVSSRQRHHH